MGGGYFFAYTKAANQGCINSWLCNSLLGESLGGFSKSLGLDFTISRTFLGHTTFNLSDPPSCKILHETLIRYLRSCYCTTKHIWMVVINPQRACARGLQ